MTPAITVEFDSDTAEYVLMVTSHNKTEPFGPRIFRAPPHPDVRGRHPTARAAHVDAEKVRAYLAQLPVRKMSKAKLREGGEG